MSRKKSLHMRCGRLVAAVLAVVLLAAALAVPVAAQGNVPQAILDARTGVVRIIALGYYGAATGSGFAVGNEDKIYIVTNYHVAEDSDTLYVLYDEAKYVTASVYYEDPSRDICILKPDRSIPHIETLPLETETFDSGLAVYALGFPAAADYFTMGSQIIWTIDDLLESVAASKNSMTITDGIVSAIHDSVLIGDGSRKVKTLQTNTAINGGNSGGPLINSEGRVVGINTIGISIADAMNGCVHVDELVRVLEKARIKYGSTPQAAPEADNGNGGRLALLIFIGVVLVGGGLAVALVLRRQKKMPVKGGMTLDEFERSYRRLEETAALGMITRFVEGLLPLARYDLNPLLTPDNVIISDTEIVLRNRGMRKSPPRLPVFRGYSAPENHQNRGGPPATVYFIGGVFYTLITGQRPPEELGRLAQNVPVFPSPTVLQNTINRMMEPYAQNRVQNLQQLYDLLLRTQAALQAERQY